MYKENIKINSSYLQKCSVSEGVDTYDSYKDMDINEEYMPEYHIINACMMGHLETIHTYLQCNYLRLTNYNIGNL